MAAGGDVVELRPKMPPTFCSKDWNDGDDLEKSKKLKKVNFCYFISENLEPIVAPNSVSALPVTSPTSFSFCEVFWTLENGELTA